MWLILPVIVFYFTLLWMNNWILMQYLNSTWKQLTYFVRRLAHGRQLSLKTDNSFKGALKLQQQVLCFKVASVYYSRIHYPWGWGSGARSRDNSHVHRGPSVWDPVLTRGLCVYTVHTYMTTRSNYGADCWETAGPWPSFTRESAALPRAGFNGGSSCCLTGRR